MILSGSIANEIGRSHLSVGDAGLYAILGYAIVFLGLVLLLIVVSIIGKCFVASAKKKASKQMPAEPAPAPAPVPAPGTAGQLKLHNVDPKTAAMLMAITANKMGKNLNELRFISIKEVTE